MSIISLKATASSYVVFGIIFGGLTVFLLFVLLKRNQPVYLALFPFAVLSMIYIWLYSYRLTIADDKLMYKSLLSKTYSIDLKSIVSSNIVFGYKGMEDINKQLSRLEIEYNSDHGISRLAINIKIFKKKEVEELMHILKAPVL